MRFHNSTILLCIHNSMAVTVIEAIFGGEIMYRLDYN